MLHESLRSIRARNGVGRPPLFGRGPGLAALITQRADNERKRPLLALEVPMSMALTLKVYGSQRAAAKALGLNLSTFQRRFKKEQCSS